LFTFALKFSFEWFLINNYLQSSSGASTPSVVVVGSWVVVVGSGVL